jgi:hypothetical protein
MIQKTFIFYSDLFESTTYIQLEEIKFSLNNDTLVIIPFCNPDTTYFEKSYIINNCRSAKIDKNGKTKTKVYFSVPYKYSHVNFILIEDNGYKYFLKKGRKHNEYHLYKIDCVFAP